MSQLFLDVTTKEFRYFLMNIFTAALRQGTSAVKDGGHKICLTEHRVPGCIELDFT